ncbi:hypothetical protein MCSF7_00396 [Mycoplasmopsis columbina SF7]|uniref:Uncharacterized protein n=1 Tax=Mycoplasmopsis columbina SF7 TaxID=1037410 RepID=F9UJN3_9BACT|nr:hypothetical protein MCSF7_00396 [Mycoplasmopsis columbina SF7]
MEKITNLLNLYLRFYKKAEVYHQINYFFVNIKKTA